ncbi:MAG: HD-GYP domain-containing protein [Azovibrio sp.]|uniref:HD-GYP domain-containing protein n=1 Tax=Azovibrio sp. TaxID=1872673 RepID=UPI003C71DE7F
MTQSDNPLQTLRRRLLLVSSVTAALVGLITWYTESERIDEKVLAMVVMAAHRIPPATLEAHAQGKLAAADLEHLVEQIATDHFGIVELYDHNKTRLIEYVPPELKYLEEELKRGGHVELTTQPRYMKHLIQGEFALVVAVPIARPGGAPVGYLEGVYLPDQETMTQIQEDVMRTVAMVVLAIVLTALTVYPVVLALHRELLARSRSILRGNLEMLEVLGSAIAQRDSDTNIHNYRVTLYAVALGEAVGIAASQMRNLIAGAFLHDVGKIGISDNILLKPGRLTPEEFAVMKTHVTLGGDILRQSAWLLQAREVVAYHHEKYDGSGYMEGLAGEAIPLNARIFAVVDVFDALTSRRPYKGPMTPAEATDIMRRDRGTHFDPHLLDRFLPLATRLHETYGQADETRLRAILLLALERYFMKETA